MQLTQSEIDNLINSKIESAVKKYGIDFKNLMVEILALEKMSEPTRRTERKLIPLSKWNEHHNTPAVGTLRQWSFHNQEFKDFCIIKQGSRLLIDEEKFFEYMEQHNL